MENETEYWLWLVMTFGAANNRIWEVVAEFEDNPLAAYNALKDGRVKGLTERERSAAATTHLSQARALVQYCAENGYGICTYSDDEYPLSLKPIYNPPAVLFYRGDISSLNSDLALTVVGTRKPSQYSIEVTTRICRELAKIGFTIVSGFAVGIDIAAQAAALHEGGKSFGVLGCGIDYDYPKENYAMREQIIANGALITEFLLGERPAGSNFPKRNRVLSALSMGTLVIEAGFGSGALITAECAIEQGRDLFCIPPASIFDARYAGVIKYLRDGAIPVFGHGDILYEYYTTYSHKLSAAEPYALKSEALTFAEKPAPVREKAKSAPKAEEEKHVEVDYSLLDGNQTAIVKLLESGAKHFDEITSELELNISELFAIITELEFMEIIEAQAGKFYKIKTS